MKGTKSVNISQHPNHHYKWNIISQLKTETKKWFWEENCFLLLFLCCTSYFLHKSFSHLDHQRVLEKDYEIVKEAVFEEKAKNKQQTRLIRICCRHKSHLTILALGKQTHSFPMLRQLGPVLCQGGDWGQGFLSRSSSAHRADCETPTVPAHLALWALEAAELFLGDRHVHVLPFAWPPHRPFRPGASPPPRCSGGHGAAPCSFQTCAQSNDERVKHIQLAKIK